MLPIFHFWRVQQIIVKDKNLFHFQSLRFILSISVILASMAGKGKYVITTTHSNKTYSFTELGENDDVQIITNDLHNTISRKYYLISFILHCCTFNPKNLLINFMSMLIGFVLQLEFFIFHENKVYFCCTYICDMFAITILKFSWKSSLFLSFIKIYDFKLFNVFIGNVQTTFSICRL